MSTAQQPSPMSDPFAGYGAFASPPAAAPSNPHGFQQQQPQGQGQVSGMNGNPYQQNAASDNPFAAYNNTQQPTAQPNTQSMVASNQQTNQWSMQQQQQSMVGFNQQQMAMTPQQQPPQMNAAYSTASTNYMTPGSMVSQTPQTQVNQMMSPGMASQSQQFFSPQQQSYPPYQQPQQAIPQQATSPVPAPAPIQVTTEEDDDFFGAFSATSNKKHEASPTKSVLPPNEFEAEYNENVSVLSKDTNGTAGYTSSSPLDDPRFAPKPPKPHGLDNAITLARNAPGASALPEFDKVTHSGYALARISFRTILIKKWKQVFWVTYGDSKLFIFRSSADFADWVSNPYLNKAQRAFLVKVEIDLVGDCMENNVRGYQVTNQRLKNYNDKMLHQFKLERWMDYGPTIAAAFGSQNEREIYQLRTIVAEMIKRSNKHNRGYGHDQPPPHQYSSNANYQTGHPPSQQFNYSDSASTGMIRDQNSIGGRSGVFSTGHVEGRSNNYNSVAGYHATSRGAYQY